MGKRESCLPHFGHFPSCCWIISSGGLRSGPSYKTYLQPWQITRCGICSPHGKEASAPYLSIATYLDFRNQMTLLCVLFFIDEEKGELLVMLIFVNRELGNVAKAWNLTRLS
jgi:hypothetical protein